MSRATIEREWQTEGLDCAVLLIDLGHRCGYVRIPEGHPFFGLDYDAKTPLPPADYAERSTDDAGLGGLLHVLAGTADEWATRVEGHIAVHGGLTFAGKRPTDGMTEGWWFGFDCAHLDDTPAQWTEDAVARETERMAVQFAGFVTKASA